MRIQSERGIALILTLFLVSALSVVAAALMFLSQTESYASMNYRMMTQARYAAEAGIQKAANFLLDSSQYAMPGGASDPLTNYVRRASPVTYNSQAVVLSAMSSKASNYPVAAVQTAFNAAASGTLTAGNATLTYNTYAVLLAMEVFDSYGGTQQVIQTWQITATGTINGTRPATVQVVATIETPKVPANSYAAFATANTCGALYLHGNVDVNSYDSTALASGATPTQQGWGGNVGTNGNLKLQGSVTVDGNLSTPRTGVGTCQQGAPDAMTVVGGSANFAGTTVQLPAAVSYPLPSFSAMPNPNVTVTLNSSELSQSASQVCSDLGLVSGTNCSVNAATSTVTINGNGTDVTMPNIVVPNGSTLIFTGHSPQANNVNINSLTGTGNIQINANLGATDTGDSVVLKVAGLNPDGTYMTTPFDVESWSINSNFKFDASTLQVAYGGTGTVIMTGNNTGSGTIYAPNAAVDLRGTSDWYGSILANTFDNGGTPSMHYDRRLQRDFYVAGHPAAGTFTWSRY